MPDRRDAAGKHPSCQRSFFRTNALTFGQALRCVRVTSLRVWLQRSAWPTAQLTAPRQCLIHTNPARCMCHFDSAGLPPQCLVELQFRDWLSAQVRRVLQRTMGCFDLQVCLLDRLQPDAFMQKRTQARPAQRWQFHTPHAQPW